MEAGRLRGRCCRKQVVRRGKISGARGVLEILRAILATALEWAIRGFCWFRMEFGDEAEPTGLH